MAQRERARHSSENNIVSIKVQTLEIRKDLSNSADLKYVLRDCDESKLSRNLDNR